MKFYLILTLSLLSFYTLGCAEKSNKNDSQEINSLSKPAVSDQVISEPLITFIELGSVNCIPCKQMVSVMQSIEEKYLDQIKIIFYDVWQADQKKYAQDYKIRLIPTQVFLNKDGDELFRHEGFFSEKEIDALLQDYGLKPQTAGL